MKLYFLLFIFLFIFLLVDVKGGRSGGGGSRGSSSGGSRGSSSGGSRGGGGWFGGSKGSSSGGWFSSGSKGSSSGSSSGSKGSSGSSGSSSSSSKGSFWNPFGSKRNDSPKPKPVTAAPPPQYRTPPSAPVFENNHKPVSSWQNNKPSSVNNKPSNSYVTPPSAPPLGGSFGGYYQNHGQASGTKTQVPSYAPPSLTKPKKFNPPYPVGQPQGSHPMPQNTGFPGSSISASKYPQVSSGSSPYNPYYNPSKTGSSPYNPYYNSGNSYPKTGIYPQNSMNHQYPSGTNPGFYGNQGHFPQSPSAPYPSQGFHSSGYHPNYQTSGASFSQPGVVYVPSVVSTSRGTGDIVKEALIHSTVNSAVNAAANRIFYPSHFSGQHYGYGSSSGYGGYTGSTTHIVHNNYYNNNPSIDSQGTQNRDSSRSDNPNNSNNPNNSDNPNNSNNRNSQNPIIANNPHYANTPSHSNDSNSSGNNQPEMNVDPYQQLNITDEELRNLTEDLFKRQEFDVNKYIKLNLQKKVNSTNVTDESIEPLFEVQGEAEQIPTIELIKFLYDNYEYDSQKKERVTPEMIKEQNNFLEVILQTSVMSRLMKWLTEKNVIPPDTLSKKEILSRIWFTPIEGSTSAFERTFMAENYWNTSVMGLQNWIYFNHMESKKEIDYLGYMDNFDLGTKGSLIKIVVKSGEIVQPTTILVGTLPELEMALYTVCFYAKSNTLCPVSLGGTKFNIFTHTFHSWGKDFLDVAVPVL